MMRDYFQFARIACKEVVPVLLELMTQQEEDAGDEDYNKSRAAYQCLQLYAQTVGGELIESVLHFVENNLRSEDWRKRDAAVSSFGAIMDGPDIKILDPLVKQALPVLIGMMDDKVTQVKDSAAFALGRMCECVTDSIDPNVHLQPLISALFNGLANNPKNANSCCWALMSLAERFAGEPGCDENPLSKHFGDSVQALLAATERSDADNQLRTAAYEVLCSFVTNSANNSLHVVANLSNVAIKRLENTVGMQQQVVNVEDRITLEEVQTSITSVILAIIQRLEGEIKPQADSIMQVLLQVLNTVPPKSSVPDVVFATISSLAQALEEDFMKYMDPFVPFLYNALGNQEEPALCALAIGITSDVVRSVGIKAQPYCDQIMNFLLNNLRVSPPKMFVEGIS